MGLVDEDIVVSNVMKSSWVKGDEASRESLMPIEAMDGVQVGPSE